MKNARRAAAASYKTTQHRRRPLVRRRTALECKVLRATKIPNQESKIMSINLAGFRLLQVN